MWPLKTGTSLLVPFGGLGVGNLKDLKLYPFAVIEHGYTLSSSDGCRRHRPIRDSRSEQP